MKIFYQRHLPHYQPPGCTFFVTFRLAGSLPVYVIQKLKSEHETQLKSISGIEDQKKKYQSYQDIQLNYFEKFDSVLDKYKKSVMWLAQPEIAETVKETIHFYDENKYDLIAYTIMPNHVHIVFTPIEENVGRDLSRQQNGVDMNVDLHKPLVADILRRLKGVSSRECNKILNRSGAFWQHESYDHVVRDEDELARIIEYVLNNPVKAGLVDNWDDWEWSYCKFVDD